MRRASARSQLGFSLVEVLVTMIILAIGLLGLVGLQTRLQVLQMEAYQRAQALMLLRDMAGRISNNRNDALAYVTTADDPLGFGMDCPADISDRRNSDVTEWCNALQGASETSGANRVGVMVGGRGCVEVIDPPANTQYLVTVVWQGMAPISAPPAEVACGADLYDGDDESNCTDDRCRRVVTTVVRIATLT